MPPRPRECLNCQQIRDKSPRTPPRVSTLHLFLKSQQDSSKFSCWHVMSAMFCLCASSMHAVVNRKCVDIYIFPVCAFHFLNAHVLTKFSMYVARKRSNNSICTYYNYNCVFPYGYTCILTFLFSI